MSLNLNNLKLVYKEFNDGVYIISTFDKDDPMVTLAEGVTLTGFLIGPNSKLWSKFTALFKIPPEAPYDEKLVACRDAVYARINDLKSQKQGGLEKELQAPPSPQTP